MNDDLRLTDELLHDMFERRARHGSADGLRDSILGATRSTAQRSSARRVLARGRLPLRLLAVAALLAGTVGAGLLVSGQRQQLPHGQHFATFAVPFDFQPVDGVPTDRPVRSGSVLGFTPSGGEMYPLDVDGRPVANSRGITLSVVNQPMVHPCPLTAGGPSRLAVRADPAGFLDDLRAVAGIGLSQPTAALFDGRPSLTATVDPREQRCGISDFHLDGGGLGVDFVRLDLPSRLIVTNVDGRTVVLQAWASTPEGLDAWLPTANRFLDGVHFTGHSSP